jgi:protein TonB
MGYSALLFCPDEKTARVVTQVLSELEFAVETCNEPFAAVKKMMAQHFDAIVVDCDNEQNATLLFKSARNSGSNQSSLAVAVVEGQAGVAKAFRIGANLVLTKPINVEQSKGTLRVARGLLRKGEAPKAPATVPTPPAVAPPVTTQAAKPAADAGSAHPSPSISAPTISAPTVSAPMPVSIAKLPAPAASPAFVPPSRAIEVSQPSASVAGFELQDDSGPQPEPAEAALLESMADPAQSLKKPVLGSREAGWQYSQVSAEPNAESKAKPAAEAVKKAPAAAAGLRPFSTSPMGTSQGAAAAAPAKEVVGLAASVTTPAEAPATASEPILPEPPTFGISPTAKSPGGGQKFLVMAVVLLASAAAGGYFAWGKFHGASGRSAGSTAATAPSAQSEPQAATTGSQPAAVEAPSIEVVATALPAATQPATATPTPEKAASAKVSVSAAPIAAAKSQPITPQAPGVEPLMVKAEGPKPPAPPPVQNSTPEEPPSVALGSGNADSAISGIVSTTPVSVPRASDTIKVSQGVAQGLLVTKVPPVYPAQAITARIQGAVVLQANITKDGNIAGLKVLSGDGVLAKAALAAVQQWKYKPYFLDGNPVEIQTQITVNFRLP